MPPGPSAVRLLLMACLALLVPWPAIARETPERALSLAQSGRFREAIAAYRALLGGSQIADPELAATVHNNLCALLLNFGENPEALPHCERALALRQASGDDLGRSRTLNNLALCLQNLGRPDEAASRFREALALNRQLQDVEGQLVNLSNLATLATERGDYSLALGIYDEAESLADQHSAAPWGRTQAAISRFNRAAVLEKLGAYAEALALYEEVGQSGALEPWQQNALAVNVGVMVRNLGDPVRAIAAFERAIVNLERDGDEAGLSNAWLNLALAKHLNLGELAAAETAYRQALALARKAGDRTEEIQDLFYLGRLYSELGRREEARRSFEECLEAATVSGSAEGRWSALEGLGRLALAEGRQDEARDLLAQAIAEIERVRSSLDTGERRAGYFGDKRGVYRATVDLLAGEAARGRSEARAESFAIVQRAKARELVEALGDDALPAPLGLTEAQARLERGEILLELFLGEKHLWAFRLTRESAELADLGNAAPLLGRVRELHSQLAHGRRPDEAELAALGEVLLAGLAAQREQGGRELIVAPDGALRYLPFEALVLAGEHEPLVASLPVRYLPSASALAGRPRQEGADQAVPWTFAGFALPEAPAVRARGGGMPLASRFELGPLPASSRELEASARRFAKPWRLSVGPTATEAAFREVVAAGAGVVHLATHTLIAESLGRGAAVLLSPADGDDGLLYPDEIAALPARTKLTVLASCSTALGTDDDAHALTSLTGAVLAAGSEAVLATLWDVGDEATAAFMEQLYYQLGRGLPAAEALRRAKLELIGNPSWNDPSLWSAYVLLGASPRVAPAPMPTWPWLLAAGLLLALLAKLGAAARRGSG